MEIAFHLVIFSSEVLIHVCDEVKNTKKDFACNQALLVEKMGYFADITAGKSIRHLTTN